MGEEPLQDRLKRIFDNAGGSDTLVDLLAEFGFEGSRELADTIVSAMAENAALIAAGDRLVWFTGHGKREDGEDCGAWWDDNAPCTCGFEEAVKAWKEARQ